jgi:stage V sporulation protein B
MSKAANIAKISAKGSFHLLWGLVVSTVISAMGTIFIARLLGSDLYGLYTVVFTAPLLISTFKDWGVNTAMIRYTAQYRAEGREDEVRSIFISGLMFEIILGATLTAISFILSGFLATNIFSRPQIAPLIQIASIIILAGALTNAATAAFIGLERMELNSVMLVCQSAIKTLVIITLVILGLGTTGATIGNITGAMMAGIIGTLLMWACYKSLLKSNNHKLEIKAYLTMMFNYGLPLSIATIISNSFVQFLSFLLPIYYPKDNIMIGNYGVAINFIVLISFFASPIITMMFPAFSKLNPDKDKQALKNIFQFSVKYAAILVVPTAALIMSLAEPAVSTLFGNTYASAPLFLALLSIIYTYAAFGNLSSGNLINSQGQTTFYLKLILLQVAIGFPMGYLLIMHFGIVGLLATSLTCGIPSLIIGLGFIKKNYGVTVDWQSSAKIITSSAIAAALTYTLIAQLNFASWIRLLIGVVIFLVIFVTAILLTRTIDKSDINNFRVVTSSLGPIGKIVNKLLNYIEKIVTAIKR